jgi:hypothetical protein
MNASALKDSEACERMKQALSGSRSANVEGMRRHRGTRLLACKALQKRLKTCLMRLAGDLFAVFGTMTAWHNMVSHYTCT